MHKVTILPTGMALGVTQQLPVEERHIHRQDYIEDTLVVRMGGRIAEELVFGVISTGANNDLVGSTELARKMVREWGMSERVGPMAWGNQGQVFLGEDLMHTRDYSDDTARIIDEEVEQILRAQEERCRETLTEHRNGLDLVARALLEHETIDGSEVAPPHRRRRQRPRHQRQRHRPERPGHRPRGPPGAPELAGSVSLRRPPQTTVPVEDRARLTGLGHGGPQVGGGDRAEERRTHALRVAQTTVVGTASIP